MVSFWAPEYSRLVSRRKFVIPVTLPKLPENCQKHTALQNHWNHKEDYLYLTSNAHNAEGNMV